MVYKVLPLYSRNAQGPVSYTILLTTHRRMDRERSPFPQVTRKDCKELLPVVLRISKGLALRLEGCVWSRESWVAAGRLLVRVRIAGIHVTDDFEPSLKSQVPN
jgi:hypothetical protein